MEFMKTFQVYLRNGKNKFRYLLLCLIFVVPIFQSVGQDNYSIERWHATITHDDVKTVINQYVKYAFKVYNKEELSHYTIFVDCSEESKDSIVVKISGDYNTSLDYDVMITYIDSESYPIKIAIYDPDKIGCNNIYTVMNRKDKLTGLYYFHIVHYTTPQIYIYINNKSIVDLETFCSESDLSGIYLNKSIIVKLLGLEYKFNRRHPINVVPNTISLQR